MEGVLFKLKAMAGSESEVQSGLIEFSWFKYTFEWPTLELKESHSRSGRESLVSSKEGSRSFTIGLF